jgi:glycosyltransferase involved in cell wall biosynthesis
MTINSPKLTIIIPTRDRAETLKYTLKTATIQKSDKIEIIISDNFSDPEVRKVFDECNDPRVKYIRTNEILGMSEHWNFAIKHATGDWITFLGDDDGLLPNTAERLFNLIEKHPDIKAITGTLSSYKWPRDVNEPDNKSRLVINSGKGYKIENCKENLIKLFKGKQVFLPTIYTGGFVRKDLINEISSKSSNGDFFQSIMPDLYSGIAISSITDNYIYSYECLAVTGSSKKSNSGTMKNKTAEELIKIPFFKENKLKFNSKLGNGAVLSYQILFYESFIQSSHLRNSDLGITLDKQLEIAIINSSSSIKQSVIKYAQEIALINNIDFNLIMMKVKFKTPIYKIRRVLKKILKRLPRFYNTRRKVIFDQSIKNILEASLKSNNCA